MKYMLLICSPEEADEKLSEAGFRRLMEGYAKLGEDLQRSGVYVAGDRLRTVSTATTVRVRDGKPLFTDGPFAETKEQIGGYYIIDVPDLDAALKWAARVPSAEFGAVEVRPIWPMEDYMPPAAP
jgi:hypothetical protein